MPASMLDRCQSRFRTFIGWALFGVLLTICLGCARTPWQLKQPRVSDELRSIDGIKIAWHHRLVYPGLLSYRPQEWASPAIDIDTGRVFIGSSARRMVAFSATGRILWQVKTSAGVSAEPLFDIPTRSVYVGTDDGRVYAMDAESGRVRWTYVAQGVVTKKPICANGLLLFKTGANRIYGVEAASGKWRWQYERPHGEGFKIQGSAGVTWHDGRAYVGFSDGVLAAINPGNGELLWTRALGDEKRPFPDITSTPLVVGESVIAASYNRGVYSLAAEDGSTKWKATVPGALGLATNAAAGQAKQGSEGDSGDAARIFVTSIKAGVLALDRDGKEVWRQSLPAGVPVRPAAMGRYIALATTESGLYLASSVKGELIRYFNPGGGISAPPTIAGNRLVFLSNRGQVYAITLPPRGG